jgi:hypothetical protein
MLVFPAGLVDTILNEESPAARFISYAMAPVLHTFAGSIVDGDCAGFAGAADNELA